jgi:epoxyqueuosine reductase
MTLSGSISTVPADTEPRPAGSETAVNQETVRDLALRAGFVEAGIVGVPHAQMERDADRFAEFVEAGRAGAMHYLERRNEQGELVRSKVHVPFPWAQSVVVCLASYHAAAPLSTEAALPGAGWIARYAWSSKRNEKGEIRPSDYHRVLLKRLRALEAEMHAVYGDFESRAYVDTGPVVERSIARAAGVGWTGKNTCLIHPKLGSWNFLAVLVTSLPVPVEAAPLTVPDRCGSCRRCLDACPTGALIVPYQMDATKCISYLTIEHRGEISAELMAGMGRQVLGCDICQDVCPWNRKAPIGRDEELAPRAELVNPALDWLADLQEADFERIFNGSPVRRAGYEGLKRNVAIAMGNSGLDRYLPWLERQANLVAGTSSALQHAAQWALDRLRSTSSEGKVQSKQNGTTVGAGDAGCSGS